MPKMTKMSEKTHKHPRQRVKSICGGGRRCDGGGGFDDGWCDGGGGFDDGWCDGGGGFDGGVMVVGLMVVGVMVVEDVMVV